MGSLHASWVFAVATGWLSAQSPPLTIDEALVLEPPGRSGRSAVWRDPVELLLVRDEWRAPEEGDSMTATDGRERSWRRLESVDGAFRDRALRGGYAYATVEAPRDEIRILEARGHRHVWVNGEPRGGDVYDLGMTHLPVQLRAGNNELLFKGGRGTLRGQLTLPRAPVYLESRDATTPDLVEGLAQPALAGILLTNATTERLAGFTVTASLAGTGDQRTPLPGVPPLSCRKVPVRLPVPARPTNGTVTVELTLRDADGTAVDRLDVELRARAAIDKHKRTFVSDIDGSVQYYAVTPAHPESKSQLPRALILSLHGASVEATNQANAYDHKSWGHVVAPTNRRPYGFDWEDWGRLDALEVLDHASQLFDPDPRRVYLTGHSMGGHGTWNVGAHFPDRFAAIAPSAGWRDFWSYSRRGDQQADLTQVEAMLDRAANCSRTLLLSDNYLHFGIYVLHGDADDNVPVSQARFMRAKLSSFHPNFAYYERAGAGHWWGNQCVDWPPLFRFLQDNVQPEPSAVRRVAFTTVHPGISASCDWVTVESQQNWGVPSTIDLMLDVEQRRISGNTSNVARLELDLHRFAEAQVMKADGPLTVALDDGEAAVPWPAGARLRLRQTDEGWATATALEPSHKGPHRAGPFKDAFRNRVVFVYGTAGDETEAAACFAKARYDAETFWYRGNGAVDIVADRDFDATAQPDRNVILYGNADVNSAWSKVLSGAPIDVRRRAVTIGERSLEGDDLACLFVYPRTGSDSASVGVVAGTGTAGLRLTINSPYFVSGAGYPDWMVFASDMLTDGASGVRGAGFFDGAWRLGDSAW